jgi:hypothetical protein
MAEAVTHSTSKMTDEDVSAIAIYLKDGGSAAPKPEPVIASDNMMRAGAAIYKDSCAACHKDTGEGEAHLFPRLAGSALVQSDDPTTLVRVVLQGRARHRPRVCRPRRRCQRLAGGSMTRRLLPSSPISGTVGAMRRHPWPQAQSRSSEPRWPPRHNTADNGKAVLPIKG